MDGLLLDTEDLYTLCVNIILEQHGRPSLPWSLKARLQGRPFKQSAELFQAWAQLPLTPEQYAEEVAALQRQHFPSAKPLAGVERLLADLGRTRYWDLREGEGEGEGEGESGEGDKAQQRRRSRRVHIALATSSHETTFRLKTAHLADLFSVFPSPRRVLGDDARIPPGRGKPLPDIWHLALSTINASLAPGEDPIRPDECLVFEDSVPGVESGRRAGMRVVWVPHPMLGKEYSGREGEVLAGRTGEAGQVDLHQLGEVGDGWAEQRASLEDFPYEKYGIAVPPPSVEDEPCMKEAATDTEVEIADGVQA
ncbi:uncharacterized protein E0L32_001685 [Thyridium curvatum]|uniref:Uncharacterized protein n=1 Tax=Thyridium curvatum TaxID=1093900 RepID=A0A507AMW7_9PEZI|nr:uncharacterized protein E0L32_001513 [Thyridium curvatum]XP_030990936.1 uncharacterized protein E0L32_001685 [Thyridium curvatum]TPX09053.1 hypothetical protein E0L32_001513 [Thyridium curvatum]TPX09225.1 hypothetical protein E0L32_001685 [Thyridium curvatum]